MNRRLYFLFPDALHARHAVDNLLDITGIDARHVHAIAQIEGKVARLPHPTARQKNDATARLETLLWNGNLALFALALLIFIAAAIASSTGWAMIAVVVMVTTFLAGFAFTHYIPHVHLAEFRDALAHGEILIMVDVPSKRVKEIEASIQRRYPEAVAGGSSWNLGAFGF